MRGKTNKYSFVFDLDNTLVETDRANNLSYMAAIKDVLKYDVTMSDKNRFTRNNLYGVYPDLSKEQFNEIVTAKNAFFSTYMSETNLNINLVKVLRALHNSGCETILSTYCHRERALSICSYYGITSLFTEMLFREDSNGGTKYDALKRRGYDLGSLILFENEADSAAEAETQGVNRKNIICVKF